MKPYSRYVFIAFLSFFYCQSLCGQDIIILNNKERIEAKVLEVEKRTIKYKKFNHLEGPSYTLEKSEIFLIIYENGTQESFEQEEEEKPPQKDSENLSGQEDLLIPTNRIKLSWQDREKMKKVDLNNYERYQKAKRGRTIWNVVGIISSIYVIGTVAEGLINFDENDPSSARFEYGADFYVAGGLSILSGLLSSNAKKKAMNAIHYHNQKVSNAKDLSLNLNVNQNGVGIVLHF